MTEKVLVTGGAGFIGSNLGKILLDHGYSVRIVDDLSAGTLENVPSGAELIKLDICDPGLSRLFPGVSTVFHLAAKTSLPDCGNHPVDATRVNVLGTANVLQACLEHGVKHLVYADTSAEYEGITELPSSADKVNPQSVYACTKAGGALLCQSFSRLHGLTVSVVRYFNVYGRAQDWKRVVPPVMSAFTVKLLLGKRPVIFGDGLKRRDFIHVDDVNAFHLKLMREPAIRGKTYNLGSGRNYSILEIYEIIEREISSGLSPLFEPEFPMEAKITLADISGTEATGWQPRVGIREGLKDFIQYTRERVGNFSS